MTLRTAFENATDSLFGAFNDVAFPVVLSQVSGSNFDPMTGIATPIENNVSANAFVSRSTTRGTDTLRDEFVFLINNRSLTALFGSGDTISFNGESFSIISTEDNSYSTRFTAVMVGAS